MTFIKKQKKNLITVITLVLFVPAIGSFTKDLDAGSRWNNSHD
jgi:hypothetical protein